MDSSVLSFSCPEFIVGINENSKNSQKRLQRTRKASTASGKDGDIVPQIRIYPFHRKGIAFIPRIADMLTRINHIDIAKPSIRTVML